MELASKARRSVPPLHDGVCFHCQQAAEKYLKALMQELELHIPKIHDLEDLLDGLLSFHSLLKSLRRGLKFLSDFAVDVRYPELFATKRQAEAAMRWAKRVRQIARELLGLPRTHKRPKRW